MILNGRNPLHNFKLGLPEYLFFGQFFFSVKKRWNVEVAYDDLFD